MNDPILEPISIGKLTLKNRIYLPAMHLNMAEDYLVTDQLVNFYAERAKGGAAMVVVGFATVDKLSGGSTNIGAHLDEHIPGLTRLASAIKDNGSLSAVQINHGGKNSFSFMIGESAVAPSAIQARMTRETPRALEHDEILQIIHYFADAAGRVQQAGFDAVEVLAGTGYLISSFLSPLTNIRTDEWGGSFENRMKFGLEVIRAIKAKTGADYPLIVRMNGNDLMPGGVGRDELKRFARELTDLGVDALNINVGWHEARIPQIVASVPRGVFGYLSKGIKDVVDVPVIASHRINDPQTAREMISDGLCDLVAMGRPLIADPYLPQKIVDGRENEIVHCIACAQGCFDHLFQLKFVQCMCNPKAGREQETIIEKTATPQKVMVIGGGPAGMSAALAAREKGHDVTLYEKSERLGGQLHLAAAPPGREEFRELARDLATQIQVQQIDIRLNTEVTESLLQQEKPDQVILATGAKSLSLPIPGADLPHVVQAWDVLTDHVSTGKRVVVIGGGAVGVETALFLAEKGTLSGDALKFLLLNGVETPESLCELAVQGTKDVTILEMLEKAGQDIGRSTRWVMMGDLNRYGVTVKTESKALEITSDGVKAERDGQTELIPADTVVMATGSEPENALQQTLENLNIPYQVTGDAMQIGLAFDAVHNGFETGRTI